METSTPTTENETGKTIVINPDDYDAETQCKLFIALRRLGIRFSGGY